MDHLFYAAAEAGETDKLCLLLEAGYKPPTDLLHRAVSARTSDVAGVLGVFQGRARMAALDWRDLTGESAVDVALRLGDWTTAECLKKSGASPRKPEAVEDKTSSASLMKAVALAQMYKMEPVASLFKEDAKKKKKK